MGEPLKFRFICNTLILIIKYILQICSTKFFDILDKVVYKLRQFPQNHHHKSAENVLRILIVAVALRATATAELSYRLINFLPLCRK